MKKYAPLILLLCVSLLLCLNGCTKEDTGITEPSATTAATTQPTTAPPAPAELYAAAIAALGDTVGMELAVSQTMTVGAQSFTSSSNQTLGFWNLGAEDLLAQFEDNADYDDYEYTRSELYGGGRLYQTVNGCDYTAAVDAQTLLSRYPAVSLLDPALYVITEEDNGSTLRFTDAVAIESWLAGEEAVPVSAEGVVTLDAAGAVSGCTYEAEYTYGPALYHVTYTVTYNDPGDAPALPSDPSEYLTVESIDGIWLMDHAYGCLLQAKQFSSTILNSVQSQAAGFAMNQQINMNSFVKQKNTDYRLETSVYAMDAQSDIHQELDEKFIDGKYSIAMDDEDPQYNSAVTSSVIDGYVLDMLLSVVFDTGYLSDAEITDLGSLYLIEYTCTEELALSLCEDFNSTYLGQDDLLHSLSSAYKTNTMEYYLALDKYTMLPTSIGYLYEGCHTIEGHDLLLIDQWDQSFDLASLTSHDAIYEEPSPDAEPENKPTPLFYRVTGPDGQQMWLFGTIHVGDNRTAYLPREIRDALLSSDALAVECDTEGFSEALEDDEQLQEQVSGFYYYDDGPVADHLETEDLHDYAVKVMKATGSYFYNSEYQKASLWSSSIDNYYLSQGHSLLSEKGVERRLEKIAEENDIPLWEIESSLFQIGMMTGYSDPLQEFLLYSSTHSHGKDNWEGVQELYELWCSGDEEALIKEMEREAWAFKEEDLEQTEDMDEEELEVIHYIRDNLDTINAELEKIYEEYILAMESDRNAGMLEVAKQYLESGDTVFYAVGLAHLLAEDGLVFTLRQAGYTVELVEYS